MKTNTVQYPQKSLWVSSRLTRHLMAGSMVLAALAGSNATAEAVNTVISDDFTGVTRYTLNDNGWYFYGTTGALPWRITPDNTAPLSGDALWNYGSSGSWIYGVKQFDAVTLGSIGDYINLTLDFHSTVNTTSGHLNLVLFNSANTVSADSFVTGVSPISDADGYGLYQAASTSATKGTLGEFVDGAGYNGFTSSASTSGSAILGAAANAHHLSLTLTRVETGIELSYSVDGTVLGTKTDTTSFYDTFNTIRLFDGGFSGSANIDNIVLTTNVPEPSTIAILSFAGGLGMLYRYQRSRRES